VVEVRGLVALVLRMHWALFFGCLGCILDVRTFRGDVACSTPLESVLGRHLAHFPHLLALLVLYGLLAALHSGCHP
jgi:hypothetical protein